MSETEAVSEFEATTMGDGAEPPASSEGGNVALESGHEENEDKSLENEEKENCEKKEETDTLEDAMIAETQVNAKENEGEVETKVPKGEEENKVSEEKEHKDNDDKEMEDIKGEQENNEFEEKGDKEKEHRENESEDQAAQEEEAQERSEDEKMEEEIEMKDKESGNIGGDKGEKGTTKKRSRGRRPAKIDVMKKKDERETSEEMLRTPPAYNSPDRPVRVRKSVVRLVEMIEKEQSEGFLIEKGRGTPLKDIPNVAYKLSRRNPDDIKLLHLILFGRKGKAINFKSHISQFSGFVWHDNEDKQREKIKEKLDKCTQDQLLDLCDIFDMPISAATSKKEDLVIKLLEFMIAPYATTATLLGDKEKHSKSPGKHKRASGESSTFAGSTEKHSRKRQRKNEDNHKPKKNATETDEDGNEETEEKFGNSVDSMDEGTKLSESEKENESEQNGDRDVQEDDQEKEEETNKSTKKEHSSRKSKAQKAAVPQKTATPSIHKLSKTTSPITPKAEEINKSKEKVFSRKKKTVNESQQSKSATPKLDKETKSAGRRPGRSNSKAIEVEDSGPGKAELKKSICEILKEVDFNTATFTDILKRLASHFKTDLTARKESIKLMIKEELTKLAEEAETSEDEDGDAAVVENKKLKFSGRGVKA